MEMPLFSQGLKWALEPRDFSHIGTWRPGGKVSCRANLLLSPGSKTAGADLLTETCLSSLSGPEERKPADCWLKKKDELSLNLSQAPERAHPPSAGCLLFLLPTRGLLAGARHRTEDSWGYHQGPPGHSAESQPPLR